MGHGAAEGDHVTKTKKLRVLREIYASIPDAGCKGLCTDQCSTIPIFDFELERLEAVTGRKLPTMSAGEEIGGLLLGTEIGTPCPMLVMGRCSVYDDRPLICRAFGSVDGLRCPHGCRPEKLLTNAEQYKNFEKVSDL
jgi:Fe-S-cluster containining protein